MRRTQRDEEARYNAVQAQITDLLDAMAADTSPYGIANLGRALLAAEMYALNEQSRQGYEARVDIVQALERRIEQMNKPNNWREELRKWFDEEQIAIAYMKHGTVPVPPKPAQEGSL